MSKQMNGTVNQIQWDGEWDGKYGLMYKYEISVETEEGQKDGQYMSKNYKTVDELPFKEGNKIYFEFVDGDYPKIKKPSLNPPEAYTGGIYVSDSDNKPIGSKPKNDDVQRYIVRQSCLTRAIEVLRHNYSKDNSPGSSSIKIPGSQVKELAEELEKWVFRTS